MLYLIPYCIILQIVHIWTIDWVLFLDIHIQICLPPHIDLVCRLVVGNDQYQTINNCFKKNSIHLRLPKICFTFNSAVVTAVWAGQNFKRSKI